MTTGSEVDHAELSQHLIRQADEELEEDDLLQASEKGGERRRTLSRRLLNKEAG